MNKNNKIAIPKNGFNRAVSSEDGKSNIQKLVNKEIAIDKNEIRNLPTNLLLDYPNHHYKAYSGDKFQNLCDSIERLGLHEPLIVNKVDDKYYILSGHNRRNALIELYKKTQDEKFSKAPCIVKENLNENLCELIVQETNLARRNFDDMDLEEKCENVHEYYNAVYDFYQNNKENIPKGFQTREEVGSRLGMNYKTVEAYNRIYKTFENNPDWYSYCPDYFDFITAYEICKMDPSYTSVLFDYLKNERDNGNTIKIKVAQIKAINKKIKDGESYSSKEFINELFDKKNNAGSNISSTNDGFDFKIPISSLSDYFDKIKNLNQDDLNMLEMNIYQAIDNYFKARVS